MVRKIRKSKKSYTIYDIYNNYCEEVDDAVSYFTFKKVLDKFNEQIKESIIDRSEMFKLPYGLGYVSIVKYKPKSYTKKSLSIDYKTSREENTIIYHLNEHSGGYKYRLYWSKLPRTFPDRYKYKLSLTRDNKRYLAQLIFNRKDYINIDDIQVYKM